MKAKLQTASLLVSVALGGAAIFATGCSTGGVEQIASAEQIASQPAAIDPQLAAAQKLIESSPGSPKGHLMAASFYINSARRSGDFSLNAKARDEVDKALAIAPKDLDARKLRATLHLTFHEFAEALKLGNELAAEVPGDPFVLGIITDAHTQLGNYPEAIRAAQSMMNAKPNSQSYARAAHLRSLHGDYSGAVEMYRLAARTADPADKEAQSWCLTQLGDLQWRNGQYDDAVKAYNEALAVSPDYPLAMFGKGRTAASKGDLAAATALISGSVERSPHTYSIIHLGDVLHAAGKSEQAEQMYRLADNAEVLGDTHDAHRIALFRADHNTNLDRALEIAEADYAELKDIYAADILAWCLYKKGRPAEARAKAAEAMRLGTNDAMIYFHAGMIEAALGNHGAAKALLKKALTLNPAFDLRQTEIAKSQLNKLLL